MPQPAESARWREPRLLGFAHAAIEIDGRVQHVHLRDLAGLAVEHAAPARTFPAWPGKRYYEGRYASLTTGSHVPFESLYEKTALMVLDRDPLVVGISSQPMWLFWPEGARQRSHAPDFFVRLATGDGVVIDVRPAERIDEKTAEVFAVTSELCAEAGLGYRVMSDLGDALARNLLFLSRYGSDLFRPTVELIEVAASVDAPTSLGELAQRLGGDASAMAAVYWLIWWGVVDVDLGSPLSSRALIRGVTAA